MEQLSLSPRLRTVADLVPQGARLADVGTDHAHLPAALLLEGRISSAICSDLRPGPLQRATATVEAYGLRERVSLRLCAGLDGIAPGEADVIALCGMGGEVMRGILEAAPWTRAGVTLLLQPQSCQSALRRWLGERGYEITLETVACEERRWYPILAARGGERRTVSPEEALMGNPAVWRAEPLRPPYLRFLREKCLRERAALLRGKNSGETPRAAELAACASALERELYRLEEGT